MFTKMMIGKLQVKLVDNEIANRKSVEMLDVIFNERLLTRIPYDRIASAWCTTSPRGIRFSNGNPKST